MDELDELNLEIPENRAEKRIENLSNKVKTFAQERDDAMAKAKEAEAAKLNLEKERDFFASFSDAAVKFPAASEYKDAIKEKVMAGYTVEDATVAVLNAQGKLAPQAPAELPLQPIAGGSAATALPMDGGRPLSEMSRAEMFAELSDPSRQAELESILRNGLR